MTRGRHSKHGNTIYHLEPNIKEFPGGLRDIHVMHWLEQLGCGPADPYDDARTFLFDLRIRLHDYFHRDNNHLTFDAQDQLADDPARFMRSYYRHARQIDRWSNGNSNARNRPPAACSASSATGARGFRTPSSPSRANVSCFAIPRSWKPIRPSSCD